VVGGALGSFVAPGVGTAIGSKLGSMASGLFEVELEGVNPQQAEFEIARRYVRFASAAARNASLAPQNQSPRAIANQAVAAAARRYAPGLLRTARPGRRGAPVAAGRGYPGGRRRGYRGGYGAPIYAPQYPTYGDSDDGNGDGWGGGAYGSQARSGRWVR